MHTDEAVHAIRFGELLENHSYQYNPFEYHGPILLYSTLIPAWLSGAHTLTDVTEVTLRLVPVLFGIGLILLLLLFNKGLDARIIIFAALFTAMSPAFVFYSRYYIMEMLLVFFSLGAIISGYRFLKTRFWGWALLTGLFIGLMHTTKETCILAWAAMGVALVLTLLWTKRDGKTFFIEKHRFWSAFALGLAAAVVVSVLFFSSFFTYGRGILDSILTYKTYITRGSGGFEAHIYPWYYYFKWLVWNPAEHQPFWTEGFIVVLALFGLVGIFTGTHRTDSDNGLLRFFGLYTLILTLIYSVIPYKTPWSMLGFYHGIVLLAAVGAVTLLQWARRRAIKWVVAILLFAGIVHLGVLSVLMNFKYDADPANPYVYAHTDKDIFKLVDAVHSFTKYWPERQDTYIEVVCPGSDYWPLPWYLREYNKVGYFNQFDYDRPAGKLIITKPSLESELLTKLYEIPPPGQRYMYIPHFPNGLWLRPGVPIELYVRKDVWDTWYRESP